MSLPKAIVPPYREIGTRSTNLLNVIGHYVEINVARMLNSTNLFRVAGRANPFLFGALLAVDVAVIGYDTYQCYNNGANGMNTDIEELVTCIISRRSE